MRSRLILCAAALLALVAACKMAAPEGDGLATEEITVTSLDAPAAQTVAPDGQAAAPVAPVADEGADEPAPLPEVEPVQSPDPALPEAPKSPEQVLCERGGGMWTVAGETGANLCVSPTRDGGKQCRKQSDCEGQCLARSGTCAPYSPLFGCNEVLDKDGRRMTLCID